MSLAGRTRVGDQPFKLGMWLFSGQISHLGPALWLLASRIFLFALSASHLFQLRIDRGLAPWV